MSMAGEGLMQGNLTETPPGGGTLTAGNLRAALLERLTRSLGKDPRTATPRDFYDALSLAVREELTTRWLATQRRVARSHAKRVCYLSVEFLPGRSLVNALSSLDGDLVDEARRALSEYGLDLATIASLVSYWKASEFRIPSRARTSSSSVTGSPSRNRSSCRMMRSRVVTWSLFAIR